ncbi:hypothetical protein, partial [Sphingomonas sp. LH128]|uniref:hypothetical protein n=1 Tax=Sphingomonas sp. LH128 TaxID=473781 RepID=UPI002E14C680
LVDTSFMPRHSTVQVRRISRLRLTDAFVKCSNAFIGLTEGGQPMKMKDVLEGYNYDLPLSDAMNDVELRPVRRLLAGALMGESLDAGYFATREMADAYYDLWNDVRKGVRYGEGYVAFEEILKDKSPLQMKLWYLTCKRDLKETVKDMRWLAILANRRAYMARAVRESGAEVLHVAARNLVVGKTPAELVADQKVWN